MRLLSVLFRRATTLSFLILILLGAVVASNNLVAGRHPAFIQRLNFLEVSDAIIATSMVLCVLPLFLVAKFSFGYLVGLYMYCIIAGFVFISYATKLEYDQSLARISAIACLITFLIPALFMRMKFRFFSLSLKATEALLGGLLVLCGISLIYNYNFGFHLAGFYESLALRNDIVRPALLNYLNGIVVGAILPFLFAYYITQKRWISTFLIAILMLLFFPVQLTKTVVFAPFWLMFLFILFKNFNPKVATVFSLLFPLTFGATAYLNFPVAGDHAFGAINLRMIAVPSIALDHYFAFFHNNPITWFCQINVVQRLTGCAYTEQLGIIMAREYSLGNFNGSFFTTEGIASLGPTLAPIGTFICGLIIGLGNYASARISPVMVAVSSGVFANSLMNVPLSTSMLSNGGVVLFLLWMIVPTGKPDRSVV